MCFKLIMQVMLVHFASVVKMGVDLGTCFRIRKHIRLASEFGDLTHVLCRRITFSSCGRITIAELKSQKTVHTSRWRCSLDVPFAHFLRKLRVLHCDVFVKNASEFGDFASEFGDFASEFGENGFFSLQTFDCANGFTIFFDTTCFYRYSSLPAQSQCPRLHHFRKK